MRALLRAFVDEKRYVPPTARELRTERALPLTLKSCIRRLAPRETWSAWRHGPRIWFVVAHIDAPPDGRGKRGLTIGFFDADARLSARATWIRVGGRFQLVHHQTSFDSITTPRGWMSLPASRRVRRLDQRSREAAMAAPMTPA
jgi:hypothetical protein